jgi:heme-degrading monooxygenase HmoA
MICRIATFDKKPDVPEERMREFRAWLKGQPGITALYHVHDPKTGKAVSITFWESEEHLLALKDRVPPGGSLGMKPSSVEVFPEVVEL